MAIEQIMIFLLGFLCAALLAIIALPSVWKRAVRLTKKRIEAATPITMTEFRAEKDQMRAGFALETRKLERTIETLHERVTEQLSYLNTAQSEMAVAKAERNRSLAVQAELEERAEESNMRIRDLEKEIADLSQRLRGHTRDIEELAALAVPEDEAPAKSTNNAISSIRRALSFGERQTFETIDGIDEAYSRISGAGNRLDAMVEDENSDAKEATGATPKKSLAARLSEEESMEQLHDKILNVEQIVADNKGTRGNKASRAKLREELGEIADMVSTIVYAKDSADDKSSLSLFERISKFTGDSLEEASPQEASPTAQTKKHRRAPSTSLSDRMSAYGKTHIGG